MQSPRCRYDGDRCNLLEVVLAKVLGEALEGALDYLLDYRKKNPNVPLDTAIADLTTQVRAA